ncbi:MAG: aminotransferase class I/II-fold pyridoxal phosphate-dependent enzyme [Mycobacteriales bacterium]
MPAAPVGEPALDLTGPWPPPGPECRRLWLAAAGRAVAEDAAWLTAFPAGDAQVREQLGGLLGTDPRRLVLTSGIRAGAAALARTARRVLIECPTFAGVPPVFASAGCEVRLRPWEALAGEQRRWSPDLVWLTSPARNPDGRTAPPELLAELAAGGRVAVNTVYRWFAAPARLPAGCVVVGGTSKLAGGGTRIGWLHHPDGPVDPAPAERATAPAHLLQRTWAHFLGADGLAALDRSMVRPVGRAAAAYRAAAGLPAVPDPVPFLLLDPAPGVSEDDLVAAFGRRGLRVGPGTAFHAPSPTVRVCFARLSEAEAAEAGKRTRALAAAGSVRLDQSLPSGTSPGDRR